MTDPEALICQCGHPSSLHVLGSRDCSGEMAIEPFGQIVPCGCPRFRLWYNDDEPTESERELMGELDE